MPDLPWTAHAEMEPGTGYLVMTSHLPPKRITATVRFFRAVSAVRRQLATADGLIGYPLRAKPLARDYWTLSVWKDDTALGSSCAPLSPARAGDDLAQAVHGTDEVRHLDGLRSRRPSEHGRRP